MSGPLEGMKVLDFSHWGVGPWSAGLLAQMGADVIKIEPPGGDYMSRFPPPYKLGVTTTYLSMNVNKRIISLDPQDEFGREVIRKMIETADVIVENRRPGFMERRGIDYLSVRKINPRIVYCSSSGYGYEGPLRDQASADTYGAAISGFASVNGPFGGEMEGLKGGGAHIDFTTSVYIVSGILTALYARELTGEGQYVQTSQMQAAMALSGSRAQEYFVSGENPKPMGSGVGNIAPSRAFLASDQQYVSISAPDPGTWQRLCRALGLTHLLEDPRFTTNADRVAHRDELDGIIQDTVSTRTLQECIDLLQENRVPAGRFMIHNEVRIHPQVKALKMLQWNDTPNGELRISAPPWRFSETPASIHGTHLPGQDTAEVLEEYGFDPGSDR